MAWLVGLFSLDFILFNITSCICWTYELKSFSWVGFVQFLDGHYIYLITERKLYAPRKKGRRLDQSWTVTYCKKTWTRVLRFRVCTSSSPLNVFKLEILICRENIASWSCVLQEREKIVYKNAWIRVLWWCRWSSSCTSDWFKRKMLGVRWKTWRCLCLFVVWHHPWLIPWTSSRKSSSVLALHAWVAQES